MRIGTVRVLVLVTASLGIASCGSDEVSSQDGDAESTPTTTTSTEASAEESPFGPFSSAVEPLEKAGFEVSPPEDGDFDGGVTAVGALDAEKAGATFSIAEFETPTDAETAGEFFLKMSEKEGFPAEVDGATLIYSVKCCTDKGPPPVIPQADFDEFVEITSKQG
jgi:hypothetical protein